MTPDFSSRPAMRSLLFVPANRPSWMEKALASAPDAIVLDLEDSVPPQEKEQARRGLKNLIAMACEHTPRLLVRVNRGRFMHDFADVQAAVSEGVSALFIPKSEGPEDVEFTSRMLAEIELQKGLEPNRISLVVPLETARAVQLSYEIAQKDRVETLVACTAKNADVARELGFDWTSEGLETLYHRSRAVIACRAAGRKHPIGGLWQDVHDLDGLKTFSKHNKSLGYTGEIVLHPSNVAVVNAVYSLSEAEVEYYRGMIDAYEAAQKNGRASLMYRGEHVDIAHVETARAALQNAGRDVD